MPYGLYSGRVGDNETWSTFSTPSVAMEHMQLEDQLQSVPKNGLVVDIGAGAGLSLEAGIHVLRPDIKVVAVDIGYSLVDIGQDPRKLLQETTELFESEQQRKLETSEDWYKFLVAGFAEELPLRDLCADMVVSYACLPEYVVSQGVALEESLRILKAGRLAIFGPMHEYVFNLWNKTVEEVTKNTAIAEHTARTVPVEVSYGEVDAYFSTIRK